MMRRVAGDHLHMKKNNIQMSSRKRKKTDPIEQAIETALSPGRFISYNAAWSFVNEVQDVANDIGKIIKQEPKRAAHLYETSRFASRPSSRSRTARPSPRYIEAGDALKMRFPGSSEAWRLHGRTAADPLENTIYAR